MFQQSERVKVTMSHALLIWLLTTFGDHHDKEVTEWCKALKQRLAGAITT